jgi:release factor glutamine methyltransferase
MGNAPQMRLLTIPGVFRPHSDSWVLARAVAARTQPGHTVLDPFTGSGILAIAAARRGARATALDVSRRAVLCTRLNAALNGVHVRAVRATGLEGAGSQRFDLIAANPPYVPSANAEARGAARAWEAGTDGRRFIDRLCDQASDWLVPGGTLLLVHSSVCGESRTMERLKNAGLEPRVIERRTGPLGPLMVEALKAQPRSGETPESEDVLVFEAVAA